MESSQKVGIQLSQIVEKSGIVQDERVRDYTYDGIVPDMVVKPQSIQEIQNVLSFASKMELSVIPTGSGTKLGIGNISQKPDIVLSTTGLNQVIEYEPADLTVTVEAGIRLTDLQKELVKHRQFFPLNPPYEDRCTIGGIISSNSSGPLRLRYGTSRNLVLGMKVVHADGTIIKSGGKVVKNVAGYDINKLYIGAYGTLGVISEVTLKLAPIPMRQVILAAQFESITEAVNAGMCIVKSQTLPMYVNLAINLQFRENADIKPTLLIAFGGDSETVDWQHNTTQSLMEQNGSLGVKIYEEELKDHITDTIREFPSVNKDVDHLVLKVNIKRTDITEFVTLTMIEGYQMMIQLGNGVVYLKTPIDRDSVYESLIETIRELRQRVMDMQGNLVVESVPVGIKQQVDVWGPIDRTIDLMKQVKVKFDGNNILNPGRFVSNI